MSFMFDDASIGGHFKVGQGICAATGEGAVKSMVQCMLKVLQYLGTP